MKKTVIFLSIFLTCLFTSVSSCQEQESIDIKQMEQIVKNTKPKPKFNYFDRLFGVKEILYYVENPNPIKLERINENKAEVQQDRDITIMRVATKREANLIIR